MNGVLNGPSKRAPLTRAKRSVSIIGRMSTSATDLDPVALVEDQAAVAMSVENDSVEHRRCWDPIAKSAEVSETPRRFWILGDPVFDYLVGAQAALLFDCCPRRRAPLSNGVVVDGKIQFEYRGWRFDPTGTGVRRVIDAELELQSSFDAMDLPLDASAESHVRADRASVEYRRILTTLVTTAQLGRADVN